MEKEFQSLVHECCLVGQVDWIGIRPKHRHEVVEMNSIQVSMEEGIAGDHYHNKSRKRQITLIQAEHFIIIESLLKKSIKPAILRRNIVVSGINIWALKLEKFQIGSCILEGTGHCHPCSRMEETLGPGGYHAVRGHGGITAKVIKNGNIEVGDTVRL